MNENDSINVRRRTVVLSALASAGVSPFASAMAATTNATQTPIRGGTLVAISLTAGEPQVLTAAFNQSGVNAYVSTKIFDGLVRFGPNSEPKPELAESWVIASDQRSVRFNLRQGVKWHDGTPFTSADVRYSYEEVWTKLHPRAKSIFAGVTSFETPDDHTLIFRMQHLLAVLFSALNSGELQILPKHLYAGTDVTRNPWNVKPVGTGPFVFKEWVRGERVVLERNPHYWDAGKPYLDRFVMRFIPDPVARYAAFETGAVQYGVLSPVSFNDIERIRRNPNLHMEFRGYEWLASRVAMEFNVRRRELADVRVRHAIAQSIDVPTMAKVVSRGLTTPGTSPVVSSLTRFYANDCARYPFDPQAAEKLLDLAGFTRKSGGMRFAVNVDWLPFGGQYQRYGEFVVQSLKRVGIDAQLRGQDLPQYFDRVYTRNDFDITVTHAAGYGDPQTGTERLFWSKSITPGIPWSNASGYESASMDAIIDAAHAAPTEAARIDQYKKLQYLAQIDLPSFTLLENRHYTIYSSKLHGLDVGSAGSYDSLKDAWLEA